MDSRRQILVVDDHRDSANTLATMLSLSGHSVVCAYDGTSAIELALRDPPDLVLLDLELQGMDGFTVAEHIRAGRGMRRVRFVAVTGRTDADALAKTSAAGFSGYLVKPISPAALESALANN